MLLVQLVVILAVSDAVLGGEVLAEPFGFGHHAGGNHGGLPPLVAEDSDDAGPGVVAVRSASPRGPGRLLSRKRRYVVFPKGSSIQVRGRPGVAQCA